jgi:S1-C subfamily serine protease
MSWDHEPPTNPPQSGTPTNPFAPPDDDGPVEGDPRVDAAPTVDATSPFRPAPTAEVPPPPPPIPPPPGTSAPPAASPPLDTGATTPPTAPPAPSPWGAPSAPVDPVPSGGEAPPTTGSPWGGAPTPPPLPPVAVEPRRPNRALRIVGALVVIVGLFGIGFGVRSLIDDNGTTPVQGAAQISIPDVTIDPGSEPVAAVAQIVSPSVVQIETTDGLGSGVVYDSSGLVMTNAHVVGTEKTVTVRTADGNAVAGEVLGADTGTDIAVVRAAGLDAPPAALATDAKPAVGQIAVAVGSPYGLDQTVTSGIVSSVNRPVDNEKGVVVNMIQTDASINPGNSGGALANRDGQIIGINTAIFSQTGENTGIGFAIPIATAKKAADQLVNGQSVAKAALGLSCQSPCDTPGGDAGAYAETVTTGGPAAQAGIKDGDVVVSVDGTTIRSFDELRGLISSHSPGETVTVTVVRDGQRLDLEVTLGTLGG